MATTTEVCAFYISFWRSLSSLLVFKTETFEDGYVVVVVVGKKDKTNE